MKKTIAIIASASLVATSAIAGIVIADKETRNPSVYIDNKAVEFPDQKAYITDEGRTLVPARGVFEAMDCTVSWDAEEYKVTINNEALKKEIVLTIDDTLMSVATDGKKESKTLEVPAQIMNDRTMIPLRAVSEALGCEVGWDGTEYRIDITSVKKEYAPLTSKIYLKAPSGTVRVGDEITVPVVLSDVKGLQGAVFNIMWNPKQLQMLGTNVSSSKSFEGFTDYPKMFNDFIDINQTEIMNGKLTVVCSADKVVESSSADYVLGNLHFKVLADSKDETVSVGFDTTELKTAGNNGEVSLAFASADGISIAVKEKLSTNTGGSGTRPSRPSSGSGSSSNSGSGSSSSGSGNSSSGSGSSDDSTTTPDDPNTDDPEIEDPEIEDPEIEDPEVEPAAVFSFDTADISEDGTVTVDVHFETTEIVNIIALISAKFSQPGVEIVGFEFSDEAKAVINTGLSNYDPATQSVIVLFNEHMQFSGKLGTFTLSLDEGISGDVIISADSNAINEGVGKVASGVLEGKIEL